MAHTRPAPSFLDAVWRPGTLIWVVILVLGLALVLTLAPGRTRNTPTELAVQFGLVALVGLWIAALLLGALHVFRHFLSRLAPLHVAWVAFAALLLVTAMLSLVISFFLMSPAQSSSWPAFLGQNVAIAGVLGIIGLGVFQTLWTNLRLKRRAEASEIAALRAMTRPHFLFNTLNTAVALVRQRPEAVEALLLDLSDLFRASIRHEQECSLEDEIDLARKYLQIEQLRFGTRLQVDWDLPEPLPDISLPTLSLQTLAENAVRHGIEGRSQPGKIRLAVENDADEVRITVSNDLPGAEAAPRRGHGLGLQSVRGRIQVLGAGAGRMTSGTADGEHHVTIAIPLSPRRDPRPGGAGARD